MVFILIFVDSVSSLVFLEYLIQAQRLHIVALGYGLFASIQRIFVLFFPNTLVSTQLIYECFSCARIKDVYYTSLEHFVKANGVVSAIMENLHYVRVDHNVSQYFSCEPKRLKVTQFIHLPNIKEESITAIIELHHFHESSFS